MYMSIRMIPYITPSYYGPYCIVCICIQYNVYIHTCIHVYTWYNGPYYDISLHIHVYAVMYTLHVVSAYIIVYECTYDTIHYTIYPWIHTVWDTHVCNTMYIHIRLYAHVMYIHGIMVHTMILVHRNITSHHPWNHGIMMLDHIPICIHVMNIIGIWYNVLPQWECILIMCVILSYWWIYHHTMTRCHDDASHIMICEGIIHIVSYCAIRIRMNDDTSTIVSLCNTYYIWWYEYTNMMISWYPWFHDSTVGPTDRRLDHYVIIWMVCNSMYSITSHEYM